MRAIITLLMLLVIAGCTEEPQELPLARSPDSLLDCTQQFLESIDELREADPHHEHRIQRNYIAAELSHSERNLVLEVGTEWAVENGYLPCHYQMCAALLERNGEAIQVIVRSEAQVDGWIPPQAELGVLAATGEIQQEKLFHTGCAHRAQLGYE